MPSEKLEPLDLFGAAYAGRSDLVRKLLAAGADVNARARAPHNWISAAPEPTALNCAVIAWEYSESLIETVQLLVSAGATIDETHFADFAAESPGDAVSQRVLRLLEHHAARQRSARLLQT